MRTRNVINRVFDTYVTVLVVYLDTPPYIVQGRRTAAPLRGRHNYFIVLSMIIEPIISGVSESCISAVYRRFFFMGWRNAVRAHSRGAALLRPPAGHARVSPKKECCHEKEL